MTIITISIGIRDGDMILEKLLNYFACQAIGYSADHTCHKEFDELESHLKPGFSSTCGTYFLLGLFPWSNLLFAIQVTDIKKAIQIIVHFYSSHMHDSQDKTLSTGNAKSVTL